MAARRTSRSLGRAIVLLGALLVVAVAAVVVVVVLQVRDGDGGDGGDGGADGADGGGAASAARPVTLDDVAAAGPLLVARAGFCDRVDPTAVEAALDGAVTDRSAYDNGDTAALTDAVDDVAHEHGCTWTGSGTVARAWVFAPPVTPGRARRLAGLVSGAAGCTTYDATAFGDPSTAFTCTTDTDTTAAHAGLFGDAWLSCSVTVPPGDSPVDPTVLQQRADAWCAAVATGAGEAAAS